MVEETIKKYIREKAKRPGKENLRRMVHTKPPAELVLMWISQINIIFMRSGYGFEERKHEK